MFSIIAFFILIIACINFMNLATARSAGRAREVGMRKAVGADRRQIITQFLGESVVISLVALVLAVALARLVMPVFYSYVGKELVLDYSGSGVFLGMLVLIGLFVGIFAGSYPAFFLSRFRPAVVLKGGMEGQAQGGRLRKGLVVFQFAISVLLVLGTLTVFKQLHFMQDYDLGFDQEQVMILPSTTARSLMPQYEALKAELLTHPGIADVTASSAVPGRGGSGDVYVEKGKPAEDGFSIGEALVDYNFMEMFDLKLVAGREFSREIVTDAGVRDENGRVVEVAMIVNEETVRRFGWTPEEALGKEILRDPQSVDWTGTIIGVMRDFHVQSLHQEIRPAALVLAPRYFLLSIKLEPGNMPEAISFVEQQVKAFGPEVPFAYSFLDEDFRAQYEVEEQLGEVFTYIAFLAILIACLGLFGLAAFTAEQRTKEIGVRKTLGATVPQIVTLLSKDFVLLVVIAFVVAAPAAYYLLDRFFLSEFAYRITMGPDLFILAGILALAIALLTVSFQAVKAAVANPVDSLRYE